MTLDRVLDGLSSRVSKHTTWSRSFGSLDGCSSDEQTQQPVSLGGRRRASILQHRVKNQALKFLMELERAGDGQSLLEAASIKTGARRIYQGGLLAFEKFVNTAKLPLGVDSEVDNAVVEYCNGEFLKGVLPHHGEKLLAAIMYTAPEFSKDGHRQLPRAWRAIQGWRLLTPPRSRHPHPLKAWLDMAVHLA